MIEARGLQKRFGSGLGCKTAVEEVSFLAPDGCVTALLGPNGAGKTTSLRILYGLLRPDAGEAVVDGALGVLPDSSGLYARLTAREHLRYGARLQGLSAREAEERAVAMIEKLGMRDIADRPAAGFSQKPRQHSSQTRRGSASENGCNASADG